MGFNWRVGWEQLRALCWKNAFLLKNRGWKSLLFLCCPFLAMSFLMLMRYATVSARFEASGPVNYSSFNITGYENHFSGGCSQQLSLAYAPNTTLAAGIMKRVLDLLDVSNSQALGMETEMILEEVLARDNAICGGIVFLFGNITHLPKHIAYKIRLHSDWYTDSMHPTDLGHDPSSTYDSHGGSIPGYYYAGFLHIQRAVDLGIIQEVNGEFDLNSVELLLNRYPHLYVNDSFMEFLKLTLPLIVLLSFSFVFDVICRDILLEKEKKLKELMRLMGIKSSIYWLSWFCKFFIYMVAVVVITTVGCYVKMSKQSLLNYTSPTVMFVFLFLYSMAVINFAFAISTFFSKASTGSTFGMLLFFLAFLPWKFMDSSWSMTTKILAMLDLHLAMAYGCDRILHYEAMGMGMQWSTIARPFGPGDGSSLLHVFMMLIVDTVLYALIAWYFNEVLPGEVGTVRPFYFPFLKSYWFGESIQESGDEDDILMAGNKDCFEKPGDNVTVGIKIRGLTKVFGKKGTAAVNNLNLDFYEGCITALVGPNGAGKSTTIFMLMGYLSQTKGSICINGMNIKHNMDKIRGKIGFCPQYDALFDYLTVREHLIFFAKIKGCILQRAENEVKDLINALQLTEKTNAMSVSLSGGMKRKLCIGNALIGDSKFIILDEPTSGLDPSSRRLIWDILKTQQKDRTMILSTHFMDEADLLGDQIAIMAKGEAKCFGSPMFLKSRYGVGYHLTVVKQPDCNVQELKTVIKSFVDSKAESNVGFEISFVLPQESTHKFETLFEALEEQQESLGIESFGVSVTTMEDVFLRVGLGGEVNSKHQSNYETMNGDRNDFSVSGVELPNEPTCVRNFLQFQGMFIKKFVCSARNYWMTFNQLYIPIFITILLCVTVFKHLGTTVQPPLHLNLGHFSAPIVPLQLLHADGDVNAAWNLSRCYSQVVNSGRGSVVEVNNDTGMDDYLLTIANLSLDNYNSRYLIGATVDAVPDRRSEKARIVGWFNNNAFHSIAISLSYVTNAVMRCFGQPGRSIEVVNHPLAQSLAEKVVEVALDRFIFPQLSAIAMSFAMGIVISTFVVFVVSERVSGAKHIQLVSSASVFNFWLGAFVWDVINFMIPSAVVIIILICFQVPGYADGTVIWFVLLDFLFYGVAIIPCVYVVSFMFQVPSTAQAFVYCIIMLLILASRVTLAVFISIPYLRSSAKVLEWVFYALLPNYCFERAFQDLYRNFESHRICSEIFGSMDQETYCRQISISNRTRNCCPDDCDSFCLVPKSYYAWEFPGIGRSLVFMVLQSVLFFALLGIIESMKGRVRCIPVRTRLRKRVESEDRVELGTDVLTARDSDVQDERERVLNMTVMEPVVIRELTKVFADFVAVDKLCLGVQKGECFGLLGVNGAGKTTCFRMLMGDLLPTSGDVFIGGHSVVKERAKVYQLVGYCPQADNHIPQMTVRETLSMVACFRGIASRNRDKVVDNFMERLMLKESANKFTCMLSGGNQRKLSIAVALIGEPPIIFLDEPTTGMDPATRRVVWDTLIAMRDGGHTLVLTSHNMEECEALCTRVAIMVNGRLNCLGSIQQLKAKFAEGFSMMIKVRGSAVELDALVQQVRAFMRNAFPDSVLKDHHQGLLSYQVHNPGLKWSYIFRTIEGSKDQLHIEDYSVSQTTLEQLFLSFARMQRESQKLERNWKDNLREFLKSVIS